MGKSASTIEYIIEWPQVLEIAINSMIRVILILHILIKFNRIHVCTQH